MLTLTPGPEHWNAVLAAIGGEKSGDRLADVKRGYHAGRGAFDRGELSSREYWKAILEGLRVPAEEELACRLFELDTAAWTRERVETVQWAAGLRAAGLRTGILSNMPWEVLALIERRMSWVAEFFPRLYSCRLGLIKPEPGIYRALFAELDVPPAQVLFLDDRLENVQAARAEGMAAEQFLSLEQILPIAEERYRLPGVRAAESPDGVRSW
ncbi:MAG: HAD-IA family hydrolase [Spirochaetales bacterium]|nr:HAD-IA family hydrolase [Spirochaetales bacterium]